MNPTHNLHNLVYQGGLKEVITNTCAKTMYPEVTGKVLQCKLCVR